MKNKDLFLLNQSKADVSISDLGIKVPMGKTINVYKANPYLTAEQVEKSLKSGALLKRLSGNSPVLKIVNKNTNKKPSNVIKQSKEAFKIKKTKSSVVIEHDFEENNDGQKFDFADYGVSEDVSQMREQSSVVVKAKEDKVIDQQNNTSVVPKLDVNLSKQSTIVMDTMVKNYSNPVGKIAENSSKNSPFVVSKQPKDESKKEEPAKSKVKLNKEDGIVMVAATRDPKNSEQKFNTVKRIGESDPVVLEKVKTDDKVATKNKKGTVVMEIKKPAAKIEEGKVKK